MAYVLLFLALAVWSALALRGRPLREYTPSYFICGVKAMTAEFTLSGLLHLYEYRSGWIADPFRDERLMAFFVVLGIDPLFILLFARYGRRHPVVGAVVTAAAVSLMEILFLRTGAMVYPAGRWSPWASLAVGIAGFLLVWWVTIKHKPPAWLHIDAVAFWAAMKWDILLHGAFNVWSYNSPVSITGLPGADSRIMALIYNGFLVAPLVALAVLGPSRQRTRVAAAAAAWLGLVGLDILGIRMGWIATRGPGLWVMTAVHLYAVAVPLLYARWFYRAERAAQT